MKHIVKHLGNFCEEVTPGLIGYGVEKEKGRGRAESSSSLPSGDGYATKEGDIMPGGFLFARAYGLAVKEGAHFSTLPFEDKKRLTLRAAQDHIGQVGTANREHYRHWLVRVRSFADRKRIKLPGQIPQESDHSYSRRIQAWTKSRPEKWPELRPAAGTHLIFSPDPKMWKAFRAKGLDERTVLRSILSRTMKDFADWRRNLYGPGHSIGWTAGTHVLADGAERHPHIHLIVLKRDESGKEVDWSVSSLRGRTGRNDPDPLLELKRLFTKNVEKEFNLHLKRDVSPRPRSFPQTSASSLRRGVISGIRSFRRGFNSALRASSTVRASSAPLYRRGELGMVIRMIARVKRSARHTPAPSRTRPSLLVAFRSLLHQQSKIRSALEQSL